ncbi:hypothetical protein OLB56_10550, partial [Streptococcus pneumoniae]|nr:hypothetical protein [Streptococcus pneumoniae]
HQKRKDEFCPFSSLADFNPLQLTKSRKRGCYYHIPLSNHRLIPNADIYAPLDSFHVFRRGILPTFFS